MSEGYSKTRVNRAGTLFAGQVRLATEGKREVGRRRDELTEAIEIIEWWRGQHARPLSQVAANLRYYAAEEGKPVVAQRLKRVPTIAGKLLREPRMKLARMGDIGGVRAVLPDLASTYRVASRLRRNWTITRFSDYVTEPQVDGYRALHLINRHRGRLIEVQLRTPRQDSWANLVEAFSRTVAPGLKFGGGPDFVREYIACVAENMAAADRGDVEDPIPRARIDELYEQVDTFLRSAKP